MAAFAREMSKSEIFFRYGTSIPRNFYAEHKDEIGLNVVLHHRDGKHWELGVHIKRTGHVLLKKNWPRFVDDNGLEEGDVVVFRLTGPNTFTFQVFGAADGLEKPLPTGEQLRRGARQRRAQPEAEEVRSAASVEGSA